MTLCDTAPLVALFGKDDPNRTRYREIMSTLSTPPITTWACVAEAMHLLGKYGGHAAQDKLWAFIESGNLTIHEHSASECGRMRFLMRQYSDTRGTHDSGSDLADASLVAAAETLQETRIFTLDSDFRVYRLHGREAFKIVP